jgi:hypothetical protein
MTHARFLGAAALAAALALPAPAAAQSLLAARGLGYLLEATDARGRGLGGAAVGLPDAALSLVNPAELAGLPAAGIAVTLHGDRVDPGVALADAFETSRFPTVQVAFPVRDRLVLSVGYASVLDQNWSTSRFDSVDVAGGRTLVTDRFTSSGGVARFRPGVAYRLGGRLDLGVALDVYTGVLRDSTVRVIENLATTASGGEHAWRGTGLGAGARWRGEALTLSAAVAGGNRLRAVPSDTGAVEGSYALPLQVDAGASARIAQTALLVVSGRWTGWSATGEDLASGSARDALHGTGGVELEGLRLLGRPLPLRFGARLTQLPFAWEGAEYVDGRALTAGAGIRFAGGAALLDLAGERGTRAGGALDESFWRVSLSLQLLGR